MKQHSEIMNFTFDCSRQIRRQQEQHDKHEKQHYTAIMLDDNIIAWDDNIIAGNDNTQTH